MMFIKVCEECRCAMYWDDQENAWVCSNCENRVFTDEDDYDAEEEDEDMPLGCQACGGRDNYPACWEACPMNPDN